MTHHSADPKPRSWVPVPADSDFPIQNLPYGVFSASQREARIGVAIGDHILDLRAAAEAGMFAGLDFDLSVLGASALNPLLATGPRVWSSLRTRLTELLTGPQDTEGASQWLVPAAEATMHLPIVVGDYIDFYSSLHHATNLGRMFRPDQEPLLPNWRYLPIGYHGRSSTVVVSGTDVPRPAGQRRTANDDGPTFGPSQRLDIELEVGFITGAGGAPLTTEQAEDAIFGMVLVNDWSARDLQAWEYVPLGPFLGKSFATTISPWVVTMDALEPFRVAGPEQHPPPLPYLAGPTKGVAIDLDVVLNGERISTTTFSDMYWTAAQQLTHVASNGTAPRPGDLYASGTVSGPHPGSEGSLIELTENGRQPLALRDGTTRTFLEDGDRVVLRGRCAAPGAVPIGFGECAGRIVGAGLPADNE